MKIFAIPALVSALALTACGPPATDTDTAEPAVAEPAAELGTVLDVAQGNEDFSTLVTAIGAAGVGETLAGSGPFTIFAPTNAAFDKLPAGMLDELTSEERKADLVNLLTYHVVPGETMSGALGDAIKAGNGTAELTTVNGAKLSLSMEGDAIVLTDGAGNTSNITATDVDADNGVIHVIDTVVMPK